MRRSYTGVPEMAEPEKTNVSGIHPDLRYEPTALLELAKSNDMTDCIVLGWGKDGTMHYGSTFDNPAEVVFLVEALKARMLGG